MKALSKYFSQQFEAFKIAGIPIRLDGSWFVIFVIYCWSIAGVYLPAQAPNISSWQYWFFGLLTTLLIFVSVLLHELGHSYFARRDGIEIKGISLYIFGGLAHMSREPKTANAEIKIAAAGPAATLALSFIFYLGAEIFLRTTGQLVIVGALTHLFIFNLLIAIFNLLPGFPMDGGRILRAFLWQRGQSYFEATRTSLQWGITIAVALIAVGLVSLFLQRNWLYGIWCLMAGLLQVQLLRNLGPALLRSIKDQAATNPSYAAKRPSKTQQPDSISKYLTNSVATTRPDISINEFLQQHNQTQFCYPVVQELRLHGMLRWSDAQQITEQKRNKVLVRDVMKPVIAEHFITEKNTLTEAGEKLAASGLGQAAVLNSDGLIIGYLRKEDLPAVSVSK